MKNTGLKFMTLLVFVAFMAGFVAFKAGAFEEKAEAEIKAPDELPEIPGPLVVSIGDTTVHLKADTPAVPAIISAPDPKMLQMAASSKSAVMFLDQRQAFTPGFDTALFRKKEK